MKKILFILVIILTIFTISCEKEYQPMGPPFIEPVTNDTITPTIITLIDTNLIKLNDSSYLVYITNTGSGDYPWGTYDINMYIQSKYCPISVDVSRDDLNTHGQIYSSFTISNINLTCRIVKIWEPVLIIITVSDYPRLNGISTNSIRFTKKYLSIKFK